MNGRPGGWLGLAGIRQKGSFCGCRQRRDALRAPTWCRCLRAVALLHFDLVGSPTHVRGARGARLLAPPQRASIACGCARAQNECPRLHGCCFPLPMRRRMSDRELRSGSTPARQRRHASLKRCAIVECGHHGYRMTAATGADRSLATCMSMWFMVGGRNGASDEDDVSAVS